MAWLGVMVFTAGIALLPGLRGPASVGLGLLPALAGATWAVLAVAYARGVGSAREARLSYSRLDALRALVRPPTPADPPPQA